jgi:phenylacetate-CoA ligase
MFVHPEAMAKIVERHKELSKVRLVVTRDGEQDVMTLQAESTTPDPAFAALVSQTLQDITKLKGEIELVQPDTLPNDGKVISDERDYSK